ncbi:MAG: ATP-binding protein [Chloroflexi bacterium]|nr:ATP-binding protein [Chloroflexota bacterium]
MRFFNTAGPVNCQDHYCLPPLERFSLDDVLTLIAQRKYFVLHAPRQTGKTTCLLALMDYLNRAGDYRALYINVEIGQSAREDVEAAMRAIIGELASRARDFLHDPFLDDHFSEIVQVRGAHAALAEALTRWAEQSPKPLVLMIDEVDALVGDTLISVLRQLRGGYDKRPALFPSTIILCGVRDVRDYRIYSDREKTQITGGSAFNIKAESLRLGDFNRAEMIRLYQEHTEETGQVFEPAALDAAWELTRGQPWLVNALGYEVTFRIKENRAATRPITAEMIQEAKENLILRRETHLDQLTDKLKEPRMRRVIEPMLQGADLDGTVSEDDLRYVTDLGLIYRTSSGPQIANAIYREVIPRELTFITQLNFESTVQPAWYIRPDGRLDMNKLLAGFQQFFREHAESWVERFEYPEAGPQLLMQAFLQRIVNGGGRVEREYGLGRKRTDLLIIWPYPGGVQRAVIELKLLHRSLAATLADGLTQTWEYADRCNADEAHLIIFDRDPAKPWEAKIFRRDETYRGASGRTAEFPVTVWGM